MDLWDMTFREEGGPEKLVTVLKKAGFSMKDYEDLDDRFRPYASYPQFTSCDLWALLGYVAEGAFSMERLPPHQVKKKLNRIRVLSKSTESGYHVYLKKLATHWLKSVHGFKKVIYELPYYGGVADVSSPNGLWSIECGCSRPAKVWDTFRNEAAADRKVVFFNDKGITIFRAGPNVQDYIAADGEFRRKVSGLLEERRKGSQ